MDSTLAILEQILLGAWHMLLEISPFLLLGFAVAGVLRVLVPEDWITRRLGGRGIGPVLKGRASGGAFAALFLRSDSRGARLRKQGASRGATLSFLVSTPETGVDSIAVTYAIMGPFLAILRPLAAFMNAVTCGLLADTFGGKDNGSPAEPDTCACCGGEGKDHRHSKVERIRGVLRFAFDDLLRDIAGWLLLGLLLAGVIGTFLSPEIVKTYIGSEWVELLLVLLISIPLYICATASTPVAAALVLAGFSPGAALVLLLAGPATNIATLLMVGRFLGLRSAAIYLASIAATSLLFGWLVNRLADVVPTPIIGDAPAEAMPHWLLLGSTVILLALMGRLAAKRLL